jgi:hypothetical protein
MQTKGFRERDEGPKEKEKITDSGCGSRVKKRGMVGYLQERLLVDRGDHNRGVVQVTFDCRASRAARK